MWGEWSLTNFEEKYNKLKDANSQRNALICHLKYHKFVLKSKSDGKKRFQETVQGRTYILSEIKENLLHIIQDNEDDAPQPILEQQQMSVVKMQEKLKLAKEPIKLKLEKLKNRKKSKPRVKNTKSKFMTSEQIVGKTVDHIFDVEVKDGTVTQVTYTGIVTRIIEKNKSNPKETLFEIVYDSVYNNGDDNDDDRQPDEKDIFEYALLQDYFEGNLILY